MMHSCLYEGEIRHRRFAVASHEFAYRLVLLYADLDELPTLFAGRWLWSVERPNLVSFQRRDYHGDPATPLAEAVRDLVAMRTGRRPVGPVRLLAHPRWFGYVFNPLALYYCFDASGEGIEAIVGEVTNTPWGERHCYVLQVPPERAAARRQSFRTPKVLHVSPFFDEDMEYRWRLLLPGENLVVHLENHAGGAKLFEATLRLRRREIGTASLARAVVAHPAMTARVWAAIHLQALRLWWKGVPFVPHPRYRPDARAQEENPNVT
jgi:uncharacterized protein